MGSRVKDQMTSHHSRYLAASSFALQSATVLAAITSPMWSVVILPRGDGEGGGREDAGVGDVDGEGGYGGGGACEEAVMSVSMEALAMAGVDYHQWGKQVQQWEQDDEFESPPPHLLAEEEEICGDLQVEMKQIKQKFE
ncbi:hypothetical protein JCGZ_24024 [Jatropha curcas]|uniref:Uncharacterized protein n=1 Tax=Jatropha curcas TaxID=180498 RepID=A0A067LPK5_JATCU|nr:hypothetical protein JCGZ_24024 [Jatropha curcas]